MDVEPLTKLASYFAFVVLVVAAVIDDQDLGLVEEVVAFVVPVVAFAVPVVAAVIADQNLGFAYEEVVPDVPVVAFVVPVVAPRQRAVAATGGGCGGSGE